MQRKRLLCSRKCNVALSPHRSNPNVKGCSNAICSASYSSWLGPGHEQLNIVVFDFVLKTCTSLSPSLIMRNPGHGPRLGMSNHGARGKPGAAPAASVPWASPHRYLVYTISLPLSLSLSLSPISGIYRYLVYTLSLSHTSQQAILLKQPRFQLLVQQRRLHPHTPRPIIPRLSKSRNLRH